MEDLSKVGNGDYEAAKPIESSRLGDISFVFQYTWIVFKSLFQCIPYLMRQMVYCCFSRKPKNVEGQIALGEDYCRFFKFFVEFKNTFQHFLVTGAANGLGKEISIQLAKVGCNLAIVDLDLENGKILAEELIQKYKIKAMAFRTDVSDYLSVQELRKNLEANLGPVDILVNNAGLLPSMSLREGTYSDIQKIFDVNLTSHFWVNFDFKIF